MYCASWCVTSPRLWHSQLWLGILSFFFVGEIWGILEGLILLMVQKSCTSWGNGSLSHYLRRVLYIQTVVGNGIPEPSTVGADIGSTWVNLRVFISRWLESKSKGQWCQCFICPGSWTYGGSSWRLAQTNRCVYDLEECIIVLKMVFTTICSMMCSRFWTLSLNGAEQNRNIEGDMMNYFQTDFT